MENNGENPGMVCTVHSCFEYIYKKNRLFGKKKSNHTHQTYILERESTIFSLFRRLISSPWIVETPIRH